MDKIEEKIEQVKSLIRLARADIRIGTNLDSYQATDFRYYVEVMCINEAGYRNPCYFMSGNQSYYWRNMQSILIAATGRTIVDALDKLYRLCSGALKHGYYIQVYTHLN